MAGERVTTPAPTASVAGMNHAPGADTACTVTLAAPTSPEAWHVGSLNWSFSEDPASPAALTLAYGTITINMGYVTTGGPGFILINPPMRFPPGTAVIAGLATGGGTSSATLNVGAWKAGVT